MSVVLEKSIKDNVVLAAARVYYEQDISHAPQRGRVVQLSLLTQMLP